MFEFIKNWRDSFIDQVQNAVIKNKNMDMLEYAASHASGKKTEQQFRKDSQGLHESEITKFIQTSDAFEKKLKTAPELRAEFKKYVALDYKLDQRTDKAIRVAFKSAVGKLRKHLILLSPQHIKDTREMLASREKMYNLLFHAKL